MPSMYSKIQNFIGFLNDIEKLKSTVRHSWTSSGRRESVAEHSWRMSVMALIIADEFPEVDMNRVIQICLVHDFDEVYEGDTPAFEKKIDSEKLEKKEREDVKKVLMPLPEAQQNNIYNLWKEYKEAKTPEGKLAKALDKLEVLIQHNEAEISTWLPLEYDLNLTHGQKYCQYNDFIKLFRKIVDKMTKEKIKRNI